MPDRRRLGADAEDRAAAYLLEKGYTLVTRRYKARHGELDLVALDGDTLVIVEVKERLKPSAAPEEAFGEQKARRLAAATREYLLATSEHNREVRYDLVLISPNLVRHIEGAFHPE